MEELGRPFKVGLGKREPARRVGGARERTRRPPPLPAPKSAEDALRQALTLSGQGSSNLARFLRQWRSHGTGHVSHNVRRVRGVPSGTERLFPCAVPARVAGASDLGHRLLLDAVGVACWIACGSQPKAPSRLPAADSPGHLSLLSLLSEQIERFLTLSVTKFAPVDAGRSGPETDAAIAQLVAACQLHDDYENTTLRLGKSRANGSAATRTVAARLALPRRGETGSLDISPYLSPPVREAFEDPSSIVQLADVPPCSVAGWTSERRKVLHRLDDVELLALSKSGDVPRGPSGEDTSSDFFTVRKDDSTDRAILKRICRNAIEEAIDAVTATMPHGCLWEDLVLSVGRKLRLSADDLPNFYHLIATSRDRQRTNAFGKALSLDEVKHLRAYARLPEAEKDDPSPGAYRALWGTLPMGDRNAVSFAQESHSNILRSGGCMATEHLIVYRRPFPLPSIDGSHIIEGVMLDDHVVGCVVDMDATREQALDDLAHAGAGIGVGGDIGVIARSIATYHHLQIPPKPEKAQRFEEEAADLWGATVGGRVGFCRSKVSVHWRAIGVSIEVLKIGFASGELVRSVAGLWVHVLTFARSAFCLLDRLYAFAGEFADDAEVRRLPTAVRDELMVLVLLSPSFERDLRAPIDQGVSCTDASSTKGASVVGVVAAGVAEALWTHRVRKRGYVRVIDHADETLIHAEDVGDTRTAEILKNVFRREGYKPLGRQKGEAICGWAEQIIAATAWESRLVFRTKRDVHINVGEARALASEVLRLAVDPQNHRKRRVFGLDSLVLVGAASKGRSSSRALNRVLRSTVCTSLFARCSQGFVHLRSAWNPADDPTRDVPIRSPGAAPSWLKDVEVRGSRGLEAAFPPLGRKRADPKGIWRGPGDFAPDPSDVTEASHAPAGAAQFGRAFSSDEAGDGPSRQASILATRATRADERRELSVLERPFSSDEKRRRARAWADFVGFLASADVTEASFWSGGPDTAGSVLALYGEQLFRAGRSQGDYVAAVLAAVDQRRAWSRSLAEAWDVASAWRKLEPSQARTPVPLSGMLAGVAACLLWGWVDFALYISLSFVGILRPSEALFLRKRDVTLGRDIGDDSVAFVSLGETKTARTFATKQSVKLSDPLLVRWLEAELAGKKRSEFIIFLSVDQVRRRFSALYRRLGYRVGAPRGLTPASLRPGGATLLFVRSGDPNLVRWSLRHKFGSENTERYLQETLAAVAEADCTRPALVKTLKDCAAALIEDRILSLHGPDPQ